MLYDEKDWGSRNLIHALIGWAYSSGVELETGQRVQLNGPKLKALAPFIPTWFCQYATTRVNPLKVSPTHLSVEVPYDKGGDFDLYLKPPPPSNTPVVEMRVQLPKALYSFLAEPGSITPSLEMTHLVGLDPQGSFCRPPDALVDTLALSPNVLVIQRTHNTSGYAICLVTGKTVAFGYTHLTDHPGEILVPIHGLYASNLAKFGIASEDVLDAKGSWLIERYAYPGFTPLGSYRRGFW